MRQVIRLFCKAVASVVMLICLAAPVAAQVAPYSSERLATARNAAPYTALHLIRADAIPDLPALAESIAAEGPDAAGVRHVVIIQAEVANISAAASFPHLILADPADAALGSLGVSESDLPAGLVLAKGAEKPIVRYFERGGRTTPSLRSMHAHLFRAWRHPALTRFPLDNNVALKGMDVVSYHTAAAPVAGNTAITSEHRGITYRFATAENRRLFAADPIKYLPAAGGWCVLAMANGEQVEADVNTYTVREGRLYLFYKGIYGDAREQFQSEAVTAVPAAEANWNRIANPRS